MKAVVREHVGATTAVLTAVSLALVVGGVRGFLPAALIPRAPDAVLAAIPTFNAVVSALAFVTILAGVRAIRRGSIGRHRRLMVAAFGLFAAFLTAYVYRLTFVEPTHFGGPAVLETFLYLPVLVIHMGLAILAIPLVFYALLLAWTHDVDDLRETAHPRVGRVAAALWLVSFALGIVVYLLLYWLFPA